MVTIILHSMKFLKHYLFSRTFLYLLLFIIFDILVLFISFAFEAPEIGIIYNYKYIWLYHLVGSMGFDLTGHGGLIPEPNILGWIVLSIGFLSGFYINYL